MTSVGNFPLLEMDLTQRRQAAKKRGEGASSAPVSVAPDLQGLGLFDEVFAEVWVGDADQ